MQPIMQFVLTSEHLKLLKNFYVGWQNCETGAPEIDPKRPYGNSSVAADVYEILTGDSIGLVDSKRDGLSDAEKKKLLKLHRETEIALQIVLSTASFQEGTYECNDLCKTWKLIA